MTRFKITELPLLGLRKIERLRLGDERGFLSRLFCSRELAAAGWPGAIAQVNHTRTELAGTLRGLHYQLPPHCEAKLVSCIRGCVWDVAVDLRRESPTFMHWHAEILSADNLRALLIPEGFAHGFQCLENGTELLYCHSAPFVPEAEVGIHYQDSRLAIPWPLPVANLSARDSQFPLLEPNFSGIIL